MYPSLLIKSFFKKATSVAVLFMEAPKLIKSSCATISYANPLFISMLCLPNLICYTLRVASLIKKTTNAVAAYGYCIEGLTKQAKLALKTVKSFIA